MLKARIIGTGSYLPAKILSNQDLEKLVETSDEWIMTRTGMKERRIASELESTSFMGTEAAKKAMEAAGITSAEIDLILVATITPDYPFPNTASLIQANLEAPRAAAVDIQAACSGYVYGLSMAKAYVESGMYRHVLLVASEKLSSVTDYQDRSTCVLFGDGASACIVSDKGAGFSVDGVVLGADGTQKDILYMPGGGSSLPASIETVQERKHFIKMEGKETYKHAVRRMESAAMQCLEKVGCAEEDLSYLVPHQANMRIIEALAKRFKMPMEKVFLTIHKYGNTSASSCGIAFDELISERDLQEGEKVLLVAFGAGLTWGAAILTNHKRDI